MKKGKELFFPSCHKFHLKTTYAEVTQPPEEGREQHAHDLCEIYFNLSGDVSFLVESTLYPIQSGSVIITRPGEYHHCVYNSIPTDHRSFCFFFSADQNEVFLPRFFDRPLGKGNLLNLKKDALNQATQLCHALIDCEPSPLKSYSLFFQLLDLLSQQDVSAESHSDSSFPPDVLFALQYIQQNLCENITVAEIAQKAFVSVNTLERHFQATLQMSPSAFLTLRRLLFAKELLKSGKSVQDACEKSGFSDYSHFIARFRKQFGVTPLQYKKQLEFLQE